MCTNTKFITLYLHVYLSSWIDLIKLKSQLGGGSRGIHWIQCFFSITTIKGNWYTLSSLFTWNVGEKFWVLMMCIGIGFHQSRAVCFECPNSQRISLVRWSLVSRLRSAWNIYDYELKHWLDVGVQVCSIATQSAVLSCISWTAHAWCTWGMLMVSKLS